MATYITNLRTVDPANPLGVLDLAGIDIESESHADAINIASKHLLPYEVLGELDEDLSEDISFPLSGVAV